jgi:dienelactone hydrolase
MASKQAKRTRPISAEAAAGEAAERGIVIEAADGWQLAGKIYVPPGEHQAPGVVLIHGSRHESDGYGHISSQGLPPALKERELAMLRIDIRGRGASREPLEFHAMTPEQRKAVRLDVRASLDCLAAQPGVDAKRLALVVEQDSADAALRASAKDRRVAAYVLISGRLNQATKEAIAAITAPVFCLVSKEDRRGFKDMTDVYLLSKNRRSRLKVFDGIGLGTTMFSAWAYEYPKEQPIEEMIGVWLAEMLKK